LLRQPAMATISAMSGSPEVFIVGAGPTGLMLAIQLARRGVTVRIVDRNAGPAQETRAVVVQARTLEFFQQMGFGDEAVREGRIIGRLRLLHRGQPRAEIPLARFGVGHTRYPFVLSLGQDQTEALLLRKLAGYGVTVERSTEVVGIEDEGAVLRVHLRGSVEERVTTRWLCGCDGASSVVRRSMGIPFDGGTYEHRFYLVDCRVDGPIPDDAVCVAPESRTFVAFFPMAGDRRFRIIGRVPTELASTDTLPFETVRDLVPRAAGISVELSRPRWTSLYRLHHRCVPRLIAGRERRVFILGDAAHVHSPVGGQGMNTGLQDATNLAWKLALAVRGAASASLLSTFEDERIPVARSLLSTTDRLFTLATDDRAIVRWIRTLAINMIAPRLLRIDRVRRRAFRAVSQTGIGYASGVLAARARTGGALSNLAAPGERLPFAQVAGSDGAPRDIADFCHAPWFTAMLLGASNHEAVDEALRHFPHCAPFVAVRAIPAIEANRDAMRHFGGSERAGPLLAIVRPDLHLLGVWPLGQAHVAFATLEASLGAGDT